MLVTLGWALLAGVPPPEPPHSWTSLLPPTFRRRVESRSGPTVTRRTPAAKGREVYLSVDESSYVAVFRVDTDGRVRVLFPREPWADAYVRPGRDLEVTGQRDGRAFLVDDDPGMGYLFAIASADPLDFRDITRGDYWDYRLIDGGRIQGDPYVRAHRPGGAARASRRTTTTTLRRTTSTTTTTTHASSATTVTPTPATATGTPTAPRAPATAW